MDEWLAVRMRRRAWAGTFGGIETTYAAARLISIFIGIYLFIAYLILILLIWTRNRHTPVSHVAEESVFNIIIIFADHVHSFRAATPAPADFALL